MRTLRKIAVLAVAGAICLTFVVLLCQHNASAARLFVNGAGIQDAVNGSQNGDELVMAPGTYFERITINKSISLVGAGDVVLLGDGLHHAWENYTGICVLNASVSVRNLTVEGFTAGIFFFNSTGSIVENITAVNNSYGVLIRYSNSTTITNSIFERNNKSVYAYAAPFMRIENCTFNGNVDGIWLEGASSGAVLRNNIIVNNTNAVRVYGSANNTVANNKVSNNSCGLYLSSSLQANITGNIISNNTKGVLVASSQNVSLSSNNIINNTEYGLSSNTNVTLDNNYIANSPLNGTAANVSLNASAASAKLNLFLPVIETFSPGQAGIAMDENDSLQFYVAASDMDSDVLSYAWHMNGALVGSGVSYNFITDYSSAGAYNLTATISDGNETVYKSWLVAVRNVNRVPYVVSRSPISPVAVNESVPLTFAVDARDMDATILTYRWYIDGNQTQERGSAMGYYGNVSVTERHNVTVVISDGDAEINITWNLTVNDVNVIPTAFIDSVIANGDGTFTLLGSGTDRDGAVVEYRWWYAGGELGNKSIVNVSLPAGSRVVHFKVRDNDGNWSEEKTVDIDAAVAGAANNAWWGSSQYVLGAVAAVVTAASVASVALFLSRRKR